MRKRSTVPWILTSLMAIFVYGLTYQAKHRPPPDPAYEFYDTSRVYIQLGDFQEMPDIFGRYNNIVEGQRKIVQGKELDGNKIELKFPVNSPRPALVYVDEKVIEIFLVPDSTLDIFMNVAPGTGAIDELSFDGSTADICQYYQAKSNYFKSVNLKASRNTLRSDDFTAFATKLDSMAAKEIAFLYGYQNKHNLPNWFGHFEHNEILYHKGYLKLSNAYNREVKPELLDVLKYNNEEAVFSYYYYLYLKAMISSTFELSNSSFSPEQARLSASRFQLATADTLLHGEMHDVFITRIIFSYLKQNKLDLTQELLFEYGDNFNKRKYFRFLQARVKEKLVG